MSYKDIAIGLGKPNAYRAVENAVGANPIPFVIHCHRILAANFKLGGFSIGKKFYLIYRKFITKVNEKNQF